MYRLFLFSNRKSRSQRCAQLTRNDRNIIVGFAVSDDLTRRTKIVIHVRPIRVELDETKYVSRTMTMLGD